MEIGLCAFPCYSDVVASECLGFVVKGLSNVTEEVDEEFKSLLSVCGGITLVIYSLGLKCGASR